MNKEELIHCLQAGIVMVPQTQKKKKTSAGETVKKRVTF